MMAHEDLWDMSLAQLDELRHNWQGGFIKLREEDISLLFYLLDLRDKQVLKLRNDLGRTFWWQDQYPADGNLGI